MWLIVIIIAKICFFIVGGDIMVEILDEWMMVLSGCVRYILLHFATILRIMMTHYLAGLLGLVEISNHTRFYLWCKAFWSSHGFNIDVADVYFLLLICILLLFPFISMIILTYSKLWLFPRLFKSIFHF